MTPIPLTETQMAELFRLRAENAALKEQVALYAGIDDEKACIAHLLDRANETIAQQAEAIRLKDVALRVAQLYLDGNCHSHKTVSSALAVQSSPEILQARDKRVAEACAKVCIEQSEGIARSTPVSRDRVHTMFKGTARPATVIDCSESSVRESAFRIRNGAWERHL